MRFEALRESSPLVVPKESLQLTAYASLKPSSCNENYPVQFTEISPKKEKQSLIKSIRGLMLAIASGVFMSLSSVIVKKVDMHPGELGLVRFLFIGFFALPMAVYSQKPWFRQKTLVILLLLRGLFDALSIFLRFEAMQRLPIADANVIIFSSPVLVAVLARFVLKEKCSVVLVLSLFLTILGLILVVKLPLINSQEGSLEFSSHYRVMGVVYGLCSVLFNASMFVIVRKINNNLHRTVILFHLGWTASIVSVFITTFFGKFTLPDPEKLQPPYLIVMGLLSLCGQLMLTAALQYEHAGPVSIARAGSDIVSAFVWQVIFFKEKPDAFSFSGAVLVTLAGLVLNLSKWVVTLPDDSVAKRNLKWLTL